MKKLFTLLISAALVVLISLMATSCGDNDGDTPADDDDDVITTPWVEVD